MAAKMGSSGDQKEHGLHIGPSSRSFGAKITLSITRALARDRWKLKRSESLHANCQLDPTIIKVWLAVGLDGQCTQCGVENIAHVVAKVPANLRSRAWMGFSKVWKVLPRTWFAGKGFHGILSSNG